MAGIHAYAIHVPRLTIAGAELQRAAGRAVRLEARRVPDHDEDEATLAIAAARALHALKVPEPSFLATASASGASFGALLCEALGLGGARLAELRGPLAGVQGLLAAQDAVAQGNAAALVVSADAPRFDDDREATAGAAASAWLLTAKGPVQLRRSAHSAAPELPGAPRGDAALVQALAALTRSGLGADSVTRAAGPDLEPRLAATLAKALPKAKLAHGSSNVGDTGATAPLLGLARALEDAQQGEAIVLAAMGQGTAAALSLEVERAPLAATLAQALRRTEPLDSERLARLRAPPSTRPDVSQGAAVSAAQFLESTAARLRWEGQRCEGCSRIQFPPRESCLGCGAARFAPARLSGKGTVHSISTIGRGSAPAEFAEQQRRAGAYDVAILEMAEGPRVAAQVCDAAAGQLRIGAPVELVVRRLYVQDGSPRYGFKARPA